MEKEKLDYLEPVEVAKGVYWVDLMQKIICLCTVIVSCFCSADLFSPSLFAL